MFSVLRAGVCTLFTFLSQPFAFFATIFCSSVDCFLVIFTFGFLRVQRTTHAMKVSNRKFDGLLDFHRAVMPGWRPKRFESICATTTPGKKGMLVRASNIPAEAPLAA